LGDILEVLFTLMILVPLAAGVGILFFRGIRSVVQGVARQHPKTAFDSAAEIERIRAKDRADARALYERVTRDKLDVIKTALAMGASDTQLTELDARLERLIGSDKLHELLEDPGKGTPQLADKLLDIDLSREIERLKRSRETEAPQ
jgi:hypothetical protein